MRFDIPKDIARELQIEAMRVSECFNRLCLVADRLPESDDKKRIIRAIGDSLGPYTFEIVIRIANRWPEFDPDGPHYELGEK